MSSVAERNPAAAPENQTEFYRHYFPYVCRFVMKYGAIKPQDAEDVANSIWVRLLARDVLSQFDPDHLIMHGGVRYQARFKSYLDKMLDLYVRHYRTQQNKRSAREVYFGGDDTSEMFELLLGTTDDTAFYADLEESMLVDRLGEYLRQLKQAPDELRQERLFFAVVAQARSYDGKLNMRQLCDDLGITTTLLKRALVALRGHIADALQDRSVDMLPEQVLSKDVTSIFGGVEVTYEHLLAAHEALTACGTNMIRQPLQVIDSPLARCDYHGVCREYRAEHVVKPSKPRHLEKDTFLAALDDRMSLYEYRG